MNATRKHTLGSGKFIESGNTEEMRPLARFNGQKPPAPAWFDAAIAAAPERRVVTVEGAPIEMLCWGPRGAPGLILVHGTNAHADWWSFTAPIFAETMRVVAFSLSGMGRSGWRDRYSVPLYGRELLAIAEAAGLFDSSVSPIALGHSFGGLPVAQAMATDGPRFAGAIFVDTMFLDPETAPLPALRKSPNKVKPSLEEAVMGFRVSPPQRMENAYLLDYIARMSVRSVDGGVAWLFDPFIFRNMDEPIDGSVIGRARGPLAMMRGDRSGIVTDETFAYPRRQIGRPVPELIIPDADHHIMLDQPLAFIAAVRGLLSAWPS